MSSLWPLTGQVSPLLQGHAHVYFLPTDLDTPRLDRLRGLLSPDEQARAARYKVEPARRTFIASRAQMRLILSGYTKFIKDSGGFAPESSQNYSPKADLPSLHAAARALPFAVHPQGKPYLAGSRPASRLRFNLSHCAGGALLAVTLDREIGVDIEPASRRVDYAKMAPRFFAPSETAQLLALPAGQQPAAFLRCWTRKEAYIKARGGGLSIPLASFTVTFLNEQLPLLTAPDPGWTLYALEPGPAFTAALVVEGVLEGLSCWAWDADI